MTVNLKISVGGNYVATVKNESGGVVAEAGPTGQGPIVEKSIHFPHGQGPQTYVVDERQATQEEIDAVNAALDKAKQAE